MPTKPRAEQPSDGARARPPWMDSLDKLDDRARYAAMSPEERLCIFAEVCEVADAVLAGRPDRNEVLGRSTPMSSEDERVWLRLVARAMREQSAR